jgi:pyruvate/2-oxoglutarate/acetoin dehydrogenase E1 component
MRVAQNLNLALHELLAANPDLHLLGEDVADPYGGAFKITQGLSERFPDRVLTTPLSEGGIVGVGAGLALAGSGAVVEIMFADFMSLAFDQLVNFASKSVTMYGRRVPMPLLVRCASGGGRGYGPTHSQSPQKHFVGVPGLSVYEASPFHDNGPLLREVFARAEPAILFEDKLLYTQRLFADGTVDDLFRYDFPAPDVARAFVPGLPAADCAIIAPGGLAHRTLRAMRSVLVDEELACQLLVPARLYPFDVEPLLPVLREARAICVVEESTAGGTWGAEVAHVIHRRLWRDLRRPVALAHSQDSVIPTATHLEEEVVIGEPAIRDAIMEAVRD